MAAKIQEFVRLVVAAVRGHEFAKFIPFEPRPRHDVEYSVAAIPIIRAQTAALDLEIFHILRVELRADSGEITVWNWNPVDFPCHTMSTPRVQWFVHDECTGHVVCNHRKYSVSVFLLLLHTTPS